MHIQNRNKGNEKARSGKGRSCLSHTSYHARSKPLFYYMSGLSVSIRGIIISCDIGVVKDRRIKQRGYTAKTSWLFQPQSGYPGCRQTGETEVARGLL